VADPNFDNFLYNISPDLKSVTFSTPESKFDAGQLDQLIHTLAVIRTSMQPPHPVAPPPIDQWLYHQVDAWRVVPRKDAGTTPGQDGFLLLVRTPGLGWTQAEFDADQARMLSAFLAGQPAAPLN
jgi:hypothetical protein